jgi:hypothetical protein
VPARPGLRWPMLAPARELAVDAQQLCVEVDLAQRGLSAGSSLDTGLSARQPGRRAKVVRAVVGASARSFPSDQTGTSSTVDFH